MEKHIIVAIALLTVLAAAPALADEAKAEAEAAPIAYVLNCKGVVECQAEDGADYVTLDPGTWLSGAAHISTHETGRASLQYHDSTLEHIPPNQGFHVGTRTRGDRPKGSGGIGGVPRQSISSRFWTAIKSLGGEMEATAGVRGGPEIAVEKKVVYTMEIPRGGRVMGKTLSLKWSGGEANKHCRVRVTSECGKELYSITTPLTCLAVNMERHGIERGGTYTWELCQKGVEGAEAAQACFYRLTRKEERGIKKEARKRRKGELKELETDAQHVSMSLFYASNDLLAEAERELKEVSNPKLADPLLKAIREYDI